MKEPTKKNPWKRTAKQKTQVKPKRAKPRGTQAASPEPRNRQRITEAGHTSGQGDRLNRYLASCGLCSRREADRMIAAGRIIINGEQVQDMGRRVQPGDIVLADSKPVAPLTQHTYLIYHKPAGLMCSRRDDRGRPLIYDKLKVAANVQSVGRLDMDSEGLLLLTDDGDLARALTRPGSKIPRVYRARITGHPDTDTLQNLRNGGIDIGRDETSDAWDVVVDAETGSHSWLTITIRRGRWREARRTLEACGHTVRRLLRVEFASLKLGDLPQEAVRPIKAGELRQLKRVAGIPKSAGD